MRQRPLTKPKTRYRKTSAPGMAASSAARDLNRAFLELEDVASRLKESARLPKIAPLRQDAAYIRRQVIPFRDRAEEVGRG